MIFGFWTKTAKNYFKSKKTLNDKNCGKWPKMNMLWNV